jgi:hypothetical protein
VHWNLFQWSTLGDQNWVFGVINFEIQLLKNINWFWVDFFSHGSIHGILQLSCLQIWILFTQEYAMAFWMKAITKSTWFCLSLYFSYVTIIVEYLYYEYNQFVYQVTIENMEVIFLIDSSNLLITLKRVVAYVLHLFIT